MKKEVVIVMAEDDEGHAELIKINLRRAGLTNEIIWFKNGQETLNFLFQKGEGPHRKNGSSYLLLLDLRMPKIDGQEVLQQVKQNSKLRRMPVICVTTADDPDEIKKCYDLGCNNYIAKPLEYDNFVEAIKRLGMFLLVDEVPARL